MKNQTVSRRPRKQKQKLSPGHKTGRWQSDFRLGHKSKIKDLKSKIVRGSGLGRDSLMLATLEDVRDLLVNAGLGPPLIVMRVE